MSKIKNPGGGLGRTLKRKKTFTKSSKEINMDKVKIKRVKRNKKKTTTGEKVLAALGLGGTLVGAMGAVAPKEPKTQFVRTQTKKDSANSDKVKKTLSSIFGIETAQAAGADSTSYDVYRVNDNKGNASLAAYVGTDSDGNVINTTVYVRGSSAYNVDAKPLTVSAATIAAITAQAPAVTVSDARIQQIVSSANTTIYSSLTSDETKALGDYLTAHPTALLDKNFSTFAPGSVMAWALSMGTGSGVSALTAEAKSLGFVNFEGGVFTKNAPVVVVTYTISPGAASLDVNQGATAGMSFSIVDNTGKSITTTDGLTVSSSNQGVASAALSGSIISVTGKSAGSSTITIGYKGASATFSVNIKGATVTVSDARIQQIVSSANTTIYSSLTSDETKALGDYLTAHPTALLDKNFSTFAPGSVMAWALSMGTGSGVSALTAEAKSLGFVNFEGGMFTKTATPPTAVTYIITAGAASLDVNQGATGGMSFGIIDNSGNTVTPKLSDVEITTSSDSVSVTLSGPGLLSVSGLKATDSSPTVVTISYKGAIDTFSVNVKGDQVVTTSYTIDQLMSSANTLTYTGGAANQVPDSQLNQIHDSWVTELNAGQVTTIKSDSVLAYMLKWGGLPDGSVQPAGSVEYKLSGTTWSLYNTPVVTTSYTIDQLMASANTLTYTGDAANQVPDSQLTQVHDFWETKINGRQVATIKSDSVLAYMLGWGGEQDGSIKSAGSVQYKLSSGDWSLVPTDTNTTAATFNFKNLNGSSTQFKVGDKWQVDITGPEGAQVFIDSTKDGVLTPNYFFGAIKGGKLSVSQPLATGDVGSWHEVWKIQNADGSFKTLSTVDFTVSASTTAIPVTTVAGVQLYFQNLTTGNNSGIKVGDKWQVTVQGQSGERVFVKGTQNGTLIDSHSVGTIGSNGTLVVSGTITEADTGSLHELWSIANSSGISTNIGTLDYTITGATSGPVKLVTYNFSYIQDAEIALPDGTRFPQNFNNYPTYETAKKVADIMGGKVIVTFADGGNRPMYSLAFDGSGYVGNIGEIANYLLSSGDEFAKSQVYPARDNTMGLMLPTWWVNATGDPVAEQQAVLTSRTNASSGNGIGDANNPDAYSILVSKSSMEQATDVQIKSGVTLTLTGKGFNTSPSMNKVELISFAIGGPTYLATVTNATSTSLTVSLPTDLPTGYFNLRVTNMADPSKYSPPYTFQVIGAQGTTTQGITSAVPVITTISPGHGKAGDTIEIRGTGFNSTRSMNFVMFDNVSVTASDLITEGGQIVGIKVLVPSNVTAGVHNVTTMNMDLATIGKASNSLSFTVDASTILGNVATPIISNLSTVSNTITQVQAGTTLVITGSNFNTTASLDIVEFIPSSGSTIYTGTVTAATATSLTVSVPQNMPIGSYIVRVTNAADASKHSNTAAFSVTAVGSQNSGEVENEDTNGNGSSSDQATIDALNRTIADLQARLNQLSNQQGNTVVLNSSSSEIASLNAQLAQLRVLLGNQGQIQTFGRVDTFAPGLQMPPGYGSSGSGLQMPAGYPGSQGYVAPVVAGIETGNLGSYTVKKGDTLWNIAKKYYGDGKKWRKILDANPNALSVRGNTRTLKIGAVLVIPTI